MLRRDLVPLILVCNEEYWLPYVLEASRGWFDKYVIYDIGSTDRTREIIHQFIESERHRTDFFVRMMPMVEPAAQGAFRNSMTTEAQSDWTLILDGDELYTEKGFEAMHKETPLLQQRYEKEGILYGVVPRIEVLDGLDQAYGQDLKVPHHRLYHRQSIFGGSHPGEYPIPKQGKNNEQWLGSDVICYHFHNTTRSEKDSEVPKRIERRGKATYHPGAPTPFDLFKALPVLRKPLGFPVNPVLAKMQ